MNEQAAREGGSPKRYDDQTLALVEDTLARVVWIRESFDPYDTDHALEALEYDLVRWLERTRRGRSNPITLSCPSCGLDCRWPGRLSDHLRIVHGEAA
jgi:hypothetical protein